MVVKVDFEVVGDEKMHCGGCETRVRFALSRMPGVQEVLASSKTQRIAVVINPAQVTLEQIQARLSDAGFEAKVTN
ncbi:heavy-metal-associated domain-containing protein [Massilia sp. Mn16-1_5]|jgi:copper chaperone|uniref:heavy-metal-associated domain-containing protein n=1 Tax=Massilia sp. Mn16-1_5 TaxID=2079199 RepID=UPI00109E68A5|nr:heavy metal-associated domain-containing protein [Massilia sp. Mn16-1_5]THC40236.1 copper resistance protein CopZ [Massilia sp. Mn16-1_5]